MNMVKRSQSIRFAVLLTYLGMIAVNAMANILPINGITTGEVSDAYPNLFAPAGITFAIWGVIYLLLAAYTLYQLRTGQIQTADGVPENFLDRLGTLFAISSVANIAWIFAWHYRFIALSLALMAVILICLIRINQQTHRQTLTGRNRLLIRLPFSVYFGWISVATIANVTTLLVDRGWNGFGIGESTWTVLILVVGIAIGSLTALRHGDLAYGLVFIWAYSGISLKHISSQYFNFRYPVVVYTAMGCIILMLLALIRILRRHIRVEKTGSGRVS